MKAANRAELCLSPPLIERWVRKGTDNFQGLTEGQDLVLISDQKNKKWLWCFLERELYAFAAIYFALHWLAGFGLHFCPFTEDWCGVVVRHLWWTGPLNSLCVQIFVFFFYIELCLRLTTLPIHWTQKCPVSRSGVKIKYFSTPDNFFFNTGHSVTAKFQNTGHVRRHQTHNTHQTTMSGAFADSCIKMPKKFSPCILPPQLATSLWTQAQSSCPIYDFFDTALLRSRC